MSIWRPSRLRASKLCPGGYRWLGRFQISCLTRSLGKLETPIFAGFHGERQRQREPEYGGGFIAEPDLNLVF